MRRLSQEDLDIILRQSASPLAIRLKCEVIDIDTQLVCGRFYGIVNGSASISADSDVRRTCNFTIQPTHTENIQLKEGSLLWMDRDLKLTVQVYNPVKYHWVDYPFGCYVFTDTSSNYDAVSNQMTINCSDFVSKLDGTKNGQIGALETSFPAYSEYRYKGAKPSYAQLPYAADKNQTDNLSPTKNDIWWVSTGGFRWVTSYKNGVMVKTKEPCAAGYYVYTSDDDNEPTWEPLKKLMDERMGYMKYTTDDIDKTIDGVLVTSEMVGLYRTKNGNRVSYYDYAMENSYYKQPFAIIPTSTKSEDGVERLETFKTKTRSGQIEIYNNDKDDGPIMLYISRIGELAKLTNTVDNPNILNYDSLTKFPSIGEPNKIYVDESTDKTYTWSDNGYNLMGIGFNSKNVVRETDVYKFTWTETIQIEVIDKKNPEAPPTYEDKTIVHTEYWMQYYRYNIIRETMAYVLTNMAGIDKYYIADIGAFKGIPEHNEDYLEYRKSHHLWNTIPSDQDFSSGDTMWSILTTFRDLYPGYELFFDPDDNMLKCQMIPMCYHDDVILDDKFLKKVVISESSATPMTEVRNVVEIWGESFETDFYASNDNGSRCPIKYVNFSDKTKELWGYSGGYAMTIEGYGTTYYNGDKISFKAPQNNLGVLEYVNKKGNKAYTNGDCINILSKEHEKADNYTELGRIPILDGEGKPIEAGVIKAGHTYTLEIRREYAPNNPNFGGVFRVTAVLLGSYRVHALSVLTDGTVSDEIYKIKYDEKDVNIYDFDHFTEQVVSDDIIGYQVHQAFDDNGNAIIIGGVNELGYLMKGYFNTNGEVAYFNTTPNIIQNALTPSFKNRQDEAEYAGTANQYKIYPYGGNKWRYAYQLQVYYDYYGVSSIEELKGLPVLEYDRDYRDRPIPIYKEDVDPTIPDEDLKKQIIYKYSEEYFKEKYNVENVDFYTCPDSPYTVQKLGELFYVESDENNIQSDDVAMDTAHWRIWQKGRITDSITLTTILLPWLDVNVKVSYRPHIVVESDEERQYIITQVSHDFSGFTTTINMYRFYPYYDYETVRKASEMEAGIHETVGTYTHSELGGYTHQQITMLPANIGGKV